MVMKTLSASEAAEVTRARARSTPARRSTSSAVASPTRGMPWGMSKPTRTLSSRSTTTKGRPAEENSSATRRPMRPKPQTTKWPLSFSSRVSMRCLPRRVPISPVTTARMNSAAA